MAVRPGRAWYYYDRAHLAWAGSTVDDEVVQWSTPATAPLDAGRLGTRMAQFAPADTFTLRARDELFAAANVTVAVAVGSTVVALYSGGDGDGDVIRRAEVVRSDGSTLSVTAEVFVLACGGVENSQVLLSSPGLGRFDPWLEFTGPLRPSFGGIHHPMGGTRIHPDPQHGVVDENCRVHGIANLYVAGSSVFPTSLGYVNPTLTVVALATRLADHLRSQLTGAERPVPTTVTDQQIDLQIPEHATGDPELIPTVIPTDDPA